MSAFQNHLVSRRTRKACTVVAAGFASLLLSRPSTAQTLPVAPTKGTSVLDSRQLEAISKQQHSSFVSLMDSPAAKGFQAGPAPMVNGKASLFGNELRYGKPNTISPDGDRIVQLIRSLVNSVGTDRDGLLAELVQASNAGVPEAMNFTGFITEHGAYGAKRDAAKALQLYRAASAAGYQAATYNLALASAYGRAQPIRFDVALEQLDRAASIAPDHSYRVCGMGAYLAYRLNDTPTGLRFAKDCHSVLATFPLQQVDTLPPSSTTLQMARQTVAVGTADGYQLLERVAARTPVPDPQFTACKYALVSRYRTGTVQQDDLRDRAGRCIDAAAAERPLTPFVRSQSVAGVAGFVTAEVGSLARLRASNRFHYGASVPYLPFGQQDADLFSALLADATVNSGASQ